MSSSQLDKVLILKGMYYSGLLALTLYFRKKLRESLLSESFYLEKSKPDESLIKYYSETKVHNITECQYKKLHEVFGKYLLDPTYVYKLCQNKWLIVMRKTFRTLDNENRKDVMCNHFAKFRASRLLVIQIININDPSETLDFLDHWWGYDKITYKVNKIIVPKNEYNYYRNVICSSGIHYFMTVFVALGWRTKPDNFKGDWITYLENGLTEAEEIS